MALVKKETFLKRVGKTQEQQTARSGGFASRADFVSGAQEIQRQRQQSTAQKYEEAYEKYKAAAATAQHDQESGYRRTQEIKWKQSTAYQDQLRGYKRTQEERTKTPEYQAAQQTIRHDQVQGMKRTSQELGKQIAELDAERDASHYRTYQYDEDGRAWYENEQGEKTYAKGTIALQSEIEALESRRAAIDSERALYTAEDRIGALDEQTRTLLSEYVGGKLDDRMTAAHKLRQAGYSDEEIKSLAEYEKYLEDFEAYQVRMEDAQQFGRDAPVFSTIISSLEAPLKALGNIESLRGVLPKGLGGYQNEDMPTNIYSPWYSATHVSSGIRSGVMEDMGQVGQFLYQTGTSALDSAVNMAVSTGLVGAAGLTGEAAGGAIANTMNWVMGSQVAADSVYEGIRNGKSNEQALIDGIVEGAIEGITEKYSVGEIIENMLSGEQLWKKLLRSFGSEGAEEVASNWLNRIYDVVSRRERSELYESYAAKLAEGMSEKDAFKAMLVEMAEEDGLSFLAGGLSGLAMSGAYELTDAAVTRYNRGEAMDVLSQAAERAMQSGSPTVQQAAQSVKEKVDSGEMPTNEEIAAFANAVQSAENEGNGAAQNLADEGNPVAEKWNGSRAAENEDAYAKYSQYAEERAAKEAARVQEQERAEDRASVYAAQQRGEITEAEANRQLDALEQAEPEGESGAAAEDARMLTRAEQEGVQAQSAVRQRAQAEEERTAEALSLEEKASEEQTIRRYAQKQGYSRELTDALVSGYQKSRGALDAAQYAEEAGKAYEYGKNGFSLNAAQTAAQGVSQDVAKAAWTAGKENANGTAKAGKPGADDGGKRNAGMDTGKPGRAVAEGTDKAKQKPGEAGRVQTNLSRENRVRDTGAAYLSGKDIGLSRGAERRSFREAPESTWDAEMKNAAETLRRAGFAEVHFTVGSIGVTNRTANVTRYIDGAAMDNAVWVNATAKRWTVTQLANHEAFHREIQDVPYMKDAVLAELTEQLGEDGIQALAQKYAEAYEGCYGEEEIEAYLEEVCADACADMNRFPKEKAALIQKAAEQAQQSAQRTQDADGARAPPEERYSVSKNFSSDIREWYEEGMPKGESFVLGSTGETLQGLGAIESDIYMNGDKIKTILKEHPEMTIREIQKIPELLDDPVLILKSKGSGKNGNSRLVVFGSIKAQNGQPMLSVLDLRPRERGFAVEDMQKVTSAYTKDNPAAFVANSDLLFADKKRTIPLLRRFGLTIASRGLLRDGSIGSISYRGKNVKLDGVPFSSIVSTESTENEKFSVAEENADTETQYTLENIPKKAQTYLVRSLNRTAAQIQNTLSLPFAARQEVLMPALETMMNEYLQTGRISQESTDKTFEESYEKGIALDTDFYDSYKDVKKWMQTTAVTLSEGDRLDIADFGAFRKAAFGRLRITNEGGMPVDTAYMELQEQAPELFPKGITHPADQLMRMFEVSKRIEKVQRSLDEAHGENAAEFKRWAKHDYEVSVEGMLGSLRVARRYAEARMRQEQASAAPRSIEEVKALYTDLKAQRRTYERAASRTLLTEEDNRVLNRLLRGELAPEDVQGMENADGILNVYEAKAEYDMTAAKLAEWKRHRKGELRAQADALLQNADKAKDKKAGILYSRETMTRNVRDIFPEADAERINKAIFEPVRTASAQANRLTNRLRDEVREMGLSRKVEKGNLVSEAHAVQLLGEAQDNIRMLEQHPRLETRDGKTLDEWRSVVAELWESSPGLERAKIERSVEGFRKIYDGLFEQMNDVRIRNGYEPVNYRSGYFPHFQPGTSDGILSLMGKALGIDAEVTALPTTINGLTHTFKPGITYFGNALERLSFDTAYDAVEGFDKYVEGAASVICYTDAIQRLRAFTDQVRYRTSDEGLRERIDAVRANENETEQNKELQIRQIMEKGRYSLSNFAVELDEYTNLLANKKSKYDRTIESMAGRNIYNIMKAWENRVAANMVAVNPASWLTNFGVITQAGAQVKTTSMLKAMWQTLQNYKQSDGIVEQSDFLTNRRGSDPLVQTWTQGLSAKLSTPMDWIDTFSADTIVRARYMENLERGMSEETAMREADDFAANVMADRAKGATPTLFSARNPIFKLFTQFQLEVNNTFSYLFKDLPREQRKKGIGALATALFKFLIGGFLYNELYEYFIGRRPMLDPIGILNDTVGDATGYELNNLVDAATGGGLIKESEPEGAVGTLTNLAESAGEEAPFIGNILGGGKLPFASSLPSLTNIASALGSETATPEEKAKKVGSELISPAAYWLLPFGGGQVKKVWQGISALKRGGSYTATGNLQYPIYTDQTGDTAKAAARTLLFGKSATPEAQAWVEAGFGSLSEKATATYEAMREAGIDQRDSYELIKAMSKVKKTDEASKKELQMQLLNAFDIEDSGKALYYYSMMASDEEKARMETLMEEGADMGEYLRFLTDAAGVTGEKDENGKTITGSKKAAMLETINETDFTPEQKNAMAEDEGYTLTGFEPWTDNYAVLYRAVSTGKELKQTVQKLQTEGYEAKDIREAITTMFKSEYQDADKAGKARLKGYLRNAFMQTGMSEKQAMNKIEGWEAAK